MRAVLAIGFALLLTAPASAERVALVAYGEGTTTCTVTVTATNYAFSTWNKGSGVTSCSVALEQTGSLSTGGSCGGFIARCEASGTFQDEADQGFTTHFRVTLVAPLGQGWLAPADKCSGVGTDRLACTFSATSFLITST